MAPGDPQIITLARETQIFLPNPTESKAFAIRKNIFMCNQGFIRKLLSLDSRGKGLQSTVVRSFRFTKNGMFFYFCLCHKRQEKTKPETIYFQSIFMTLILRS